MKKTLSFAVLFAGISLATFAQENKDVQTHRHRDRKHVRVEHTTERRTPEEIAKAKTERLAKQLEFTDAQRDDVYAVQLEQAKQVVAHREEMKTLAEKRRADRKASQEKMTKILTPEQQQQWKESYAQHGKRKPLKMRRGPVKPRTIMEKPTAAENNTES